MTSRIRKTSVSSKYHAVSKEQKRITKIEKKGKVMGNNHHAALTRLIGVATVITYFNIAYCVALIGPTLLDLLQLTNVSWDRMGVLLMGRAGCTVIGNMIAGLLANSSLFSLLLLQSAAHLVVLISQVFIPLCRNQTDILLVFVVQGVFLGTNNNLCNILTLSVQGQAAHAWMQGLFMAYSGAVLLAPIVSTPFLSEAAAKKQSMQSCNATHNLTSLISPDYDVTNTAGDVIKTAGDVIKTAGSHGDHGIHLEIPYWTCVVPCGIALILYLVSAVWTRVSGFKTPEMLEGGQGRRLSPVVIVLSFFLALLYFTLDGCTGRFLLSFAVKSKLCMSVKTAGLLTALFGGATCLMRGTCAAVAAVRPSLVRPTRLLTANHVALSLALIAILVGRDSLVPTVWIFAFFSGIGVSNGFPSLMALMKSQGASKKVVSVLPIGGGVGITLGPLLTTYLMNDNVAGPGPGFYSLFCVVTHLATLLFGALMSSIDHVTVPAQRQKNVSISYGKDQGIIVNDNISEKGEVTISEIEEDRAVEEEERAVEEEEKIA